MGGSLIYADQLLKYLSHSWPGQQLLFLKLHATTQSLVIGWAASVVVSFLTILWAVRVLSRMTPTRLLAGDTTATVGSGPVSSPSGRGPAFLLAISAMAAGGLVANGFIGKGGEEAQALNFFGGGFFALVIGLTLMWGRLRGSAQRPSNPRQSLAGLAVRNAGRHAVRSLLTIGLLASATFLIVAVESFHKEAGAEFLQKNGGSGGFPLYAQSDVPIFAGPQ